MRKSLGTTSDLAISWSLQDLHEDELCRNNLWSGEDCERTNCLICYSGDEQHGDCRKRNVTYSNQCLACLEVGRESVYYGETARSSFERGTEHAREGK